MFTGIVEELGRFRSATRTGETSRLAFGAELIVSDVVLGASIAVNGCCLTVVDYDGEHFAVDVLDETLSRTNLGELVADDPVNLERSVALGERLGGHLVQGHVDGVGVVVDPAPHLVIEVPENLGRYLVEKGSLAVDGCSLTLVEVLPTRVRIEIIPHTADVTTLGLKPRGSLVNLEVDVVAKYVERLVAAGVASPYSATPGQPL
jgi:riboflavin synthase